MKIVEIARTYIINRKEKPGNSGFEDPSFEVEMAAEGWLKKNAWCATFAKLIAKKAYPEKAEDFNKLFNPSAVRTFNNFLKSGKYDVHYVPVEGDLVVWQRYQNNIADWKGHVGIVSSVISATSFTSIEGNTNVTGSPEGDRVQEKHRLIFRPVTGLRVLGFVKLN